VLPQSRGAAQVTKHYPVLNSYDCPAHLQHSCACSCLGQLAKAAAAPDHAILVMSPRRWHTIGLAAEPEGVQALREVHAAGAQLDAAAHHDARRGCRELVRLATQGRLLPLQMHQRFSPGVMVAPRVYASMQGTPSHFSCDVIEGLCSQLLSAVEEQQIVEQ